MTQTPRRRQLLDAAQAVIADEGLKGLTHRAVDRRAGLPEGSCSAYLRTRQALQAALAAHVAEQL
ncbi:MAG: TetR family transcriptional regulator, partial [Nocardioidaceae bacterium]|nr:TetR family transcriptional regulator [Nocardioidaceae bacterium]